MSATQASAISRRLWLGISVARPTANAAGAVEQAERQARGQLFGLFGGAVVVGDEVHRALVDLVQQQLVILDRRASV